MPLSEDYESKTYKIGGLMRLACACTCIKIWYSSKQSIHPHRRPLKPDGGSNEHE